MVIVQEVTTTVKDPNGLVRNDLAQMEKWLPRKGWKEGDMLDHVAYRQGQHDYYKMVVDKIVGRR